MENIEQEINIDEALELIERVENKKELNKKLDELDKEIIKKEFEKSMNLKGDIDIEDKDLELDGFQEFLYRDILDSIYEKILKKQNEKSKKGLEMIKNVRGK